MSLNKFSELFLNLDSSNSINKKLDILKNYFSTNEDLENSWSVLNNNGFLLVDDYMWWYYKNLENNPASSVNTFINKNIDQISKLIIWHQVLIQKK